MAEAVVMNFAGATPEQYDQILNKMGVSSEGLLPPGGLFHLVTKVDNGLQVIEVWENRESFETFLDEQFGPAAYEVGVPQFPDITFHEVHDYLTALPASGD